MTWTRGRDIGRGSSATVSIATALGSSHVFAVKSCEVSQSQFLQRENDILSSLKCPQIIEYKGCDVTLEKGEILYNLFMEFASGGTLTDAIHGFGGCLDELMIRTFVYEILLGIEYLHANGIVHCDIKGQNILLVKGRAKIADLGCARRVDEVSDTNLRIAGTPVFMAPEVARGEQQSFPADIWALGCTMMEMATGRAPWPDVEDPVSALYRIGFSGDVPEIPSFLSDQAKDFLTKCLTSNSSNRWCASDLLKHDFLAGIKFPSNGIKIPHLDTPTSVLDQCFWDSTEKLENQTQSSTSPTERIRQLSECRMMPVMPNWEGEDEYWVTVRSNRMDEEEICRGNRDLWNGNEETIIEMTERGWMWEEQWRDELNLGTWSGEIDGINISCSSGGSSSSSNYETNSFMACKSTCTNINVGMKRAITFFVSFNKTTYFGFIIFQNSELNYFRSYTRR